MGRVLLTWDARRDRRGRANGSGLRVWLPACACSSIPSKSLPNIAPLHHTALEDVLGQWTGGSKEKRQKFCLNNSKNDIDDGPSDHNGSGY